VSEVPAFGDRVQFAFQYQRFVGRRIVWPRGDASRYLRPAFGHDGATPHPDSTLPETAPRPRGYGYMLPVAWKRIGNGDRWREADTWSGVFGGVCRKSEGFVGSVSEEGFGHAYKHHAYVPLAEVMLHCVGKPLFAVVHLDDLVSAP
jgi:hypothetical protein